LQHVISMAFSGKEIDELNKDKATFDVFNRIFGGGDVSRLFLKIREDLGRMRYEGARASGRMREVSPEKKWTDELEAKSRSAGEAHKLSLTDRQLLSLGLHLKSEGKEPTIVSDDYSVQNMAVRLGFNFVSQATKGITKVINWGIYCPGCRRKFDAPQEDNVCPICGTELKRKPRRG